MPEKGLFVVLHRDRLALYCPRAPVAAGEGGYVAVCKESRDSCCSVSDPCSIRKDCCYVAVFC